ncbi:MAG: hypothetical protein L0H15_09010 [Nitrosospira sp.]|nr:hypothetical protein [Nitrosospira sp.]
MVTASQPVRMPWGGAAKASQANASSRLWRITCDASRLASGWVAQQVKEVTK